MPTWEDWLMEYHDADFFEPEPEPDEEPGDFSDCA